MHSASSSFVICCSLTSEAGSARSPHARSITYCHSWVVSFHGEYEYDDDDDDN